MWRFRLKRLMIEREVLIGLFIFGLASMSASFLSYIGWLDFAAIIQGLGLLFLIGLLIFETFLRHTRKPLPVPILFTENTDRNLARNMFNSFVQAAKLNQAVKILAGMANFQLNDLIIRLNRPNPRESQNPQDWTNAWDELLREWDLEIDRKLMGETLATDGRCYHIFPHIVLPLAFALGASVNLRRPLVLYHQQGENYYHVLDLTDPRKIFLIPSANIQPSILPPQIVPENTDTLPNADKLILHIIISARHPLNFNVHPDFSNAANAALIYPFDLKYDVDWLPYVQWIFQKASPLIARYRNVEICLICPSVIAFALGMAFSRTPHLTVCHWLNSQYRPVFQLSQIERRIPLPFS